MDYKIKEVHRENNGVGGKIPMAVEVHGGSIVTTFYRAGGGIIRVYDGPYDGSAMRNASVRPVKTISAQDFNSCYSEAYRAMFG